MARFVFEVTVPALAFTQTICSTEYRIGPGGFLPNQRSGLKDNAITKPFIGFNAYLH